MINRVLIRIKVIQILYSYFLAKGNQPLTKAKKELQESLNKARELYFYLLKLMVDLTDLEDETLEDAKNKFLPTEEDLNPNTKFIDNDFIKALRNFPEFKEYINDNLVTWRGDEIFLKLMLNKVKNSDAYKEYMAKNIVDFDADCDLWHALLKDTILVDDDLADNLENRCFYWSVDDVDIMGQFAMKTVNRFKRHFKNPIMPMYKDEEDSQFGDQLFTASINEFKENNELIDGCIKVERWDIDRVALMDRIIMSVAITEMKGFPSIPTTVTLNEYIELAKNFSTTQSNKFVNGILNAAKNKLRNNGSLVKP